MKKSILFLLACGATIGAFAQGTVVFDNRVGSTLTCHVYSPLALTPWVSQQGQGTNDRLAGSTDWSGYIAVGAPGGLSASTTFATLLGAPGYNQPESSLVAASSGVTTFRTGTAAGAVSTAGATFNNIPANAAQATLQMVAWDNSTGLYSTWALASVAWLQGFIAAGWSAPWNQDSLGGGIAGGPFLLNSQIPGQQVMSFNLFTAPEPSTFALAGLGAAALLILRRRK